MRLFNFFRKKEEKLSNEEIEKEYQKSIKIIQSVDGNSCSSFVRDMKDYAERVYPPKQGVDLLTQKSEFMRIYAFRAYQWRCYYTLGHKKGKFNSIPLWCQKWQNYEQNARLAAQKRWREIISHSR